MALLGRMRSEDVSQEDDATANQERAGSSQENARKAERKKKRWEKPRQEEHEAVPEVDPDTLVFFMQPVKPIFSPQERVDMEKRVTATQFVKQTLKYFLFLVIFTWVTLANRPSWAFEASEVMRQTVLYNISKVSSVSDTWDLFEQISLPVLFPYTDPSTGEVLSLDEMNLVHGVNRLIGQVRIRQIRIQKNSGCTISKHFTGRVDRCIAKAFSSSYEAKNPLMAGVNVTTAQGTTLVTQPTWFWKSGKQLCNSTSSMIQRYCLSLDVGVTDIVYPASGYVIDLPPPEYFDALASWNASNSSDTEPPPSKLNYSLAVLENAKANKWIDSQTVYVVLEFAVYNPSVRVMTGVRASLEFFSSGGVNDKVSIYPVSFGGLVTIVDFVSLIGDLVILLWVIVFIIDHLGMARGYFAQRPRSCMVCSINRIKALGLSTLVVCQNCQHPFDPLKITFCPECYKDVTSQHTCWRGYFQDPWNYLDAINLIFFLVVLGFQLLIRFDMTRLDLSKQVTENSFINLFPLAWQIGFVGYLNAFNMLMTYLQALRYLGQIKSLAMLLKTLRYSFNDVLKFLLLFFIVYMGFALAFFSAFGADMYEFRDIITSLVTMFLALLGQFDYYDMEDVNSWLAPLLFVPFMILTVLILVNMFISIIDAAYVKANSDAHSSTFDFLNSALRLMFREWRRKLCCDEDHVLANSMQLFARLESIPDLRKEEREDVRRFRKAMSDLPDHQMLSAVLLAFKDHTPEQEWVFTDYLTLRSVVRAYKRGVAEQQRNRGRGVWEENAAQVGTSKVKGLANLGKNTSLTEIRHFWKQDRYLTEHLLGVMDRMQECAEVLDELLPKVQQWKATKKPLPEQQRTAVTNILQQLQRDWLSEPGAAAAKPKAAPAKPPTAGGRPGGDDANPVARALTRAFHFPALQRLRSASAATEAPPPPPPPAGDGDGADRQSEGAASQLAPQDRRSTTCSSNGGRKPSAVVVGPPVQDQVVDLTPEPILPCPPPERKRSVMSDQPSHSPLGVTVGDSDAEDETGFTAHPLGVPSLRRPSSSPTSATPPDSLLPSLSVPELSIQPETPVGTAREVAGPPQSPSEPDLLVFQSPIAVDFPQIEMEFVESPGREGAGTDRRPASRSAPYTVGEGHAPPTEPAPATPTRPAPPAPLPRIAFPRSPRLKRPNEVFAPLGLSPSRPALPPGAPALPPPFNPLAPMTAPAPTAQQIAGVRGVLRKQLAAHSSDPTAQ